MLLPGTSPSLSGVMFSYFDRPPRQWKELRKKVSMFILKPAILQRKRHYKTVIANNRYFLRPQKRKIIIHKEKL